MRKRNRKRLTACAVMIAGLTLSAVAAEDIAYWDFNGPDGTTLSNVLDSISGYHFNDHQGVFLTNNHLHVEYATNAMYNYVTFNSPISYGTVRASWTILPSQLNAGNVGIVLTDEEGRRLASLRFDSANSKLRLSSYARKPDDSGNQWIYVAWLGGVPNTTEDLNLKIEYHIDTGIADLSWSGAYTGTKSITGFPATVTGVLLEARPDNFDKDAGDHVEMDDLLIQHIGQPTGAYLADRAGIDDLSSSGIVQVASFSVTNGDYVVLAVASSLGSEPVETSATFSGTADIGTVQYLTQNSGAGAPAFLWYVPVNSNGTVEISLEKTVTNGSFSVGAYLVRSATGGLELLGTAGSADQNLTEIVNAYDFTSASVVTGLFIEAVSAYKGLTPSNTETTIDYNQWSQRIAAHGEFVGTTLTNVWGINGTSQASIVGIAFAPLPSGKLTPQQKYDQWAAGYPTLNDTSMEADPDGDGYDNLCEYAFGGDPVDGTDAGHIPVVRRDLSSDTNYFWFVYYERTDAADRGLTSMVEASTDLLDAAAWNTNGVELVGRGPSADPEYEAVTNRVPMTEIHQFLRLKIEFTP